MGAHCLWYLDWRFNVCPYLLSLYQRYLPSATPSVIDVHDRIRRSFPMHDPAAIVRQTKLRKGAGAPPSSAHGGRWWWVPRGALQEIVSLLWSFAKLGFDPGHLLNRMLARLEGMLEGGISGQAVTNTLWAMAVLQACPPTHRMLTASAGIPA